MAELISPGVAITVNDQTQSASTGPGTVPLIIIATASNKLTPDGLSIAPGTTQNLASSTFLMTSQRELLQTFGAPYFESLNGTIIQGSEVSEYGLQAAYSYLGIANRAYVLRADVDLDQLKFRQAEPTGEPANGTYWFDFSNSSFGVFKANGNSTAGLAWDAVTVLTPTVDDLTGGNVPDSSYGSNGDIAIVTETTNNLHYEKISGSWYLIGSTAWKAARPTVAVGTATNPTLASGNTITINGSTVTISTSPYGLTQIISDINAASISGITASNTSNKLTLTYATGGNITLSGSGSVLTTLGLSSSYAGYAFTYASHTSIPTGTHSGDIWLKTTSPNFGVNYIVKRYNVSTGQFETKAAPFYVDDSAADTGYGSAKTIGSLYVNYDASSNNTVSNVIRRWDGSNWSVLTYVASSVTPSTQPTEGTLWISDELKVDVMVNDGNEWKGYINQFPATDPDGVQITSAEPTEQSNGDPLVANDLWLDSSDLENYPKLYRWDGSEWVLLDKTDSTTPFGIVFADARPNDDGTETGSTDIVDMLESDYVDPDTVNPQVYPAGILLFNTRYSTYNVKEWKPNYFNGQGDYTVGTGSFDAPEYVSRWVTKSGNQADGSPYMGRFAQRKVIVDSLAEQIISNEDIRSEFIFFNLLSAPGYPELTADLINLNIDRKETAFIIADTPLRLAPSGTSINNWANNVLNRPSTDEFGRTNLYTYAAEYYPHGLTTSLTGEDVVVPSSSIALNTYAFNDNVSYPWFSPAGTQRGVVTNASSVGYITSENEFQPVILNQGQRDVLYTNKINPIAFLPGRGLSVYGDKTIQPVETAQSRVNVARLVCFLRYGLEQLTQPFLFQLNNETTRAAAKSVVERYLGNLLALGAITDFAVVCDLSNNSPAQMAQNILNIGVAIIPQKSINFIYIPIALMNSDSL